MATIILGDFFVYLKHTRFLLYKHTLFSAKPGVAYRKAVLEPQACLDVCLENQRTFVYEVSKKVVLIKAMYMTKKKNIKLYFFFQCLGYCFKVLGKNCIFKKFCCQFQNLRLGVCLAMCLKFPEC